MEQDKTTFPKKETATSEKQAKTAINDYAKDYSFDEIPGDWKSLINATHDPDIKRWFTDFQLRKIYLYQLNRLFANSENNLRFSPNTVKIGFIDPDKVIVTDAWEVNDYVASLNQRNTSNTSDNQAIFELTDSKNLIFQDAVLPHNSQPFVLSINEPVTEANLKDLYIVNSYIEPWKNPKLKNTKSLLVTKVTNFTANNGYPIIVKIQKQLDQDTKVTGIKIKYPKPMLFGNIKLIGSINGVTGYTKSILDDKYINFPLLSMPIETEPKVRLLEWWFSEQILPWELAKQFLTENSVLDLIKIESGTETRKEVIPNARVTSTYLGRHKSEGGAVPTWPLSEEALIQNDDIWGWPAAEPGARNSVALTDKHHDVEIEIKDAPTIDSLQKVLLNMLSYTYNYYRNFDGTEYKDGNPNNDIARLKEKFNGQKPEDVITNIWKQWELDNPAYKNSEKVKIFKQIIILLSKYILSKLSINMGLNDDVKLLVPYYFELTSNPLHANPGNTWDFKDCKVILKSEYFDFSDNKDIKLKNSDLSQNQLYQLDENQFNWLTIINELESNAIPSLLPPDWKLSDGEFAKYFTNLIINKEKIENFLNLYGKLKSALYSKYELFKLFNSIITDTFEVKTEIPLDSIKQIEVSGIYGHGIFDIMIETNKSETIILQNIQLFSAIEKISLINIEI